ncbi:hypothetical protein [Cryobacterium sp. MLB-32]|uniref:hypothetical protein n=1 Tax=Cryobacterium sp. MLB-32 TaxID=1529318 RepID=UPI000691C99A|nr:hypothetical protein [Cryobacterium sp. MLB-32]
MTEGTVMADVRKSAQQSAARTRAREKAAEFRQKHDTLEQLATDYFVAMDSVDEIEASAQKEMAAVRERATAKSTVARAKALAMIASMLDLGAPRAEVADRLGLATRDVKKPPTAPKKGLQQDDSKEAEPVSEGFVGAHRS